MKKMLVATILSVIIGAFVFLRTMYYADVEAKMVVPVVSIKGKVGTGERITDDNIQLFFVPYIKYKKYEKQFILWQDRNKIIGMINAYNKKNKECLMYKEVYMPIVENK